jgi:hypothetical protein
MRRHSLVAFGILLAASPLAAQQNPFAFTGGSVKSAYIVYQENSKQKEVQGSTFEIGVASDRWIMRTQAPMEMAGKKDTVRVLAITTRDSQYTFTSMGGQKSAEASPLMRPHLAREYAALSGSGKDRFRQNLKLAIAAGGSNDSDMFITLVGDKLGSETIAGHKCDVYKTEKSTACVIPGAPGVMLRWTSQDQGTDIVAKKVTLNGPIPPAMSVLPKGVQWTKKPVDDADFMMNVWALKKQTDPETQPPASVAKFTVGYLASPAATAELQAMVGSSGGSDGAPADEPEDDESGS